MERVIKENMVMVWICVALLSVLTVLSFGMTMQTVKGCSVLIGTGIVLGIICKTNLDNQKKALLIVLLPSYAILLFSALLGGNAVSFLATFITLGMASRYFEKKIIQYYAIPFSVVALLCAIFNYKIIADYSLIEAVVKVVIFAVTSFLIYKGTAFGEKKVLETKENEKVMVENQTVAVRIADSLNQEIASCGEEMKQVNHQAAVVSDSTEKMEAEIQESADTILSVNEKVNSSMEQIRLNYEYAKQLEESFGKVNEAVEKSNSAAEHARGTMSDMAVSVGEAQEVTIALRDKMKDITEILDKINSIASQTNLLSLNASIEAARAGEHGRGFAVVADEIRALSEESSNAAGDIQRILAGLSEMAGNVAEKVIEGADAAKDSSERIENLMDILGGITQATQDASEVVSGEYQIIENVKQEFTEVQTTLKEVATTAENNASMVADINQNIQLQSEAVKNLSEAIGKIQNSSSRLEEHFDVDN